MPRFQQALYRQRDFAEMLLAGLMRKRVSDLIEREVFIQHGFDIARFDGGDHVFLMRARAHRNP